MIFKSILLYYYIKYKYFTRFSNKKKLQKYQERKIKKHLKYISKHSPYYTTYQNKELHEYPIINKATMMEHFDQMNTVGIRKEEAFSIALAAEASRNFKTKYKNITVGLSSGTSGNRGLFIVSNTERAKWTGVILAKILPKTIFHTYKIAFFLRADSNLYQSVNSSRITFSFFDLIEDLETHIQKLNHFQPDILVAPASMLKLLATHYDKLHITPYKLISIAEVLDEIDKPYIENRFGIPCDEIYQATEGFLGYRKGPYFTINEDIIYVEKEYVAENRFVPIITDFSRTSQPIIRYRLNDLWQENKSANETYLSLEKVLGREDDILQFKDKAGKEKYIFPDFISRIIITASEAIEEYQVSVHTNPPAIQIGLQIRKGTTDSKLIEKNIQQKIYELMQRNQIETIPIHFSTYIPQPQTTKKRRIQILKTPKP